MKFYNIPSTLDSEIGALEAQIQKYEKKEITAKELRAWRVPFGVYEQRTKDTFMVRTRCTAGCVTPEQLKAVAQLSNRYGSDEIHVTTRQALQIHDVALKDVVEIIRQLKAVGLATRGGGGNTVRNIMASWDAGIAQDEPFDMLPYVLSLTSRLISESDSWILPRKYKISFSNTEKDNAMATFNDLGFISHIKNDVKGFRVYVAGGMGSKPQVGNLLHDFIPAEQVYPVARAIKVIFSRYGNRKNKHAARLRFLWNKLGREKFIQLYSDEYEKIQKTHPAPLQIIEIENKPEPDILLEPVREQTSEFEIWKKRYVKGQKQPGLYSILLPVFLGNISNKDTVILADFLSHFGENVLRCTLEQNFSIRNIPEDYLGNVYRIARDISRLSSGPRFMANSIACAGADTCTLGICRSRGALRAVDRKLEKSGIDLDALSNFKLNISGCPNSCGAHSEADLGFFGKSSRKKEVMYPAYVIVAGAVAENGASRLARKIAQVSARDLPDFLLEALAAYLDKKGRYPSFAAYIDDCGESDIRNICRKYTDIPDFEDDKNYYFDWGAGEIFSLVGIGAGECSAGLFDLIDVDRENIKNQQKSLQTLSDAREISEALYQITLSASRMLLITRGVEVKTEKEVFDAFIAKFIMESLVDKKFTRLVQLARNKDDAQLNGLADQIHELADVTEKLYESMDDSLQFQTEKEKMDSGGLPAYQNAEVNRDYRGIACPMNFVKMKLDLSRMSSGQTLRVLLDDGKPIENVPGSLSGEGHELVFQEKIDDYWAVLIKKA